MAANFNSYHADYSKANSTQGNSMWRASAWEREGAMQAWKEEQAKKLDDPNTRAVVDLVLYNTRQSTAREQNGDPALRPQLLEQQAVKAAAGILRDPKLSYDQIRDNPVTQELLGLADYIEREAKEYSLPSNRTGNAHGEAHLYGYGDANYYAQVAAEQGLPVEHAPMPTTQIAQGIGSLTAGRHVSL